MATANRLKTVHVKMAKRVKTCTVLRVKKHKGFAAGLYFCVWLFFWMNLFHVGCTIFRLM